MSELRFQLNGRWRTENGVSPTTTLAGLSAAECAADRHQGRLRRRRLRRLHRRGRAAAGRRAHGLARGQFLSDAGAAGRRPAGDHGRGAGAAGRHAAFGAAEPGRGRRHAMRLLHAGLCDGDVRLRAGRKRRRARDDETIHEALAGNLCRCTGYRADRRSLQDHARRSAAAAASTEMCRRGRVRISAGRATLSRAAQSRRTGGGEGETSRRIRAGRRHRSRHPRLARSAKPFRW